MAQIGVEVDASGYLKPGPNVGGKDHVYAEKGDTIHFVMYGSDGLPLDHPTPPLTTDSLKYFTWWLDTGNLHVGIGLKDGVPVGTYWVTFGDDSHISCGVWVVYSDVLVTVTHGDTACSLSGSKVRSGETIYARPGDKICFRLVSTATTGNCTFDAPPLKWTSPDQCQGMAVTRVSDTEFTVADNGRAGGRFDFKLDIDKFTVTGKVHCQDDPTVLNADPP